MQRHAFLIIAHNQYPLLEKLIRLLDHPQNDIYIHADKKAVDFDPAYFAAIPRHSGICFSRRVRVTWGGASMIEAELTLLEAAVEGKYDYYHLLSGVDLPIKPMDCIHRFFREQEGKELIHFGAEQWEAKPHIQERAALYHFLHEWIGRERGLLRRVENLSLAVQRRLGINRLKKRGGTVRAGANWFSITHGFARYVTDHAREIRKDYRFTSCADEIFLQTVFVNSPFRDNAYVARGAGRDSFENVMRFIDWDRGQPYVFGSGDFEELMASPCLFARKFDLTEDAAIVERVYESILSRQEE